MHGFVDRIFEQYISKENPFAVPIAALVYIPMAAMLPALLHYKVLVQREYPLAQLIAFMMAVVNLSIPEGLLLKKVINKNVIHLLALYNLHHYFSDIYLI
ncbi:MAG: hypothetical protein IPF62_12075 [Bacteroidetes bacterium]|nr:hypothetical protein [Bacteroidota bacterium]